MRAHFTGTTAPATADADGWWVPLDAAAAAFGWKVTDLGGGIGLCPDDDTCVPVPGDDVRHAGGVTEVRLDPRLRDALGLVAAANDREVVFAVGATGAASAGAGGDLSAIRLPDARAGRARGLTSGGRRTALYVWASW